MVVKPSMDTTVACSSRQNCPILACPLDTLVGSGSWVFLQLNGLRACGKQARTGGQYADWLTKQL